MAVCCAAVCLRFSAKQCIDDAEFDAGSVPDLATYAVTDVLQQQRKIQFLVFFSLGYFPWAIGEVRLMSQKMQHHHGLFVRFAFGLQHFAMATGRRKRRLARSLL